MKASRELVGNPLSFEIKYAYNQQVIPSLLTLNHLPIDEMNID
jgi:hypothetical protein